MRHWTRCISFCGEEWQWMWWERPGGITGNSLQSQEVSLVLSKSQYRRDCMYYFKYSLQSKCFISGRQILLLLSFFVVVLFHFAQIKHPGDISVHCSLQPPLIKMHLQIITQKQLGGCCQIFFFFFLHPTLLKGHTVSFSIQNPARIHQPTDRRKKKKKKTSTKRHTNLSCVPALHCVKCGRDSFALAAMMVISPSSPMIVMMVMMMVMMISSVREARVLLCVGCDSPWICVGRAPVSPLRRQKTPTPDRKQHPSAETTRLSLYQAENDMFGGRHDVLEGLSPPPPPPPPTHTHTRDSMCPIIRKKRGGSRPGAVQVLKNWGFQRLQMCDEWQRRWRRRQRGGETEIDSHTHTSHAKTYTRYITWSIMCKSGFAMKPHEPRRRPSLSFSFFSLLCHPGCVDVEETLSLHFTSWASEFSSR